MSPVLFPLRLKKKSQSVDIGSQSFPARLIPSLSLNRSSPPVAKTTTSEVQENNTTNSQRRGPRCSDLKRGYTIDTGQKKTPEKKDGRRMSFQRPKGTIEYSVESRDTLNNIALKFDTTPNELVQLNKLFSRNVVPGQVLYVPDPEYVSSAGSSPSFSPMAGVSFFLPVICPISVSQDSNGPPRSDAPGPPVLSVLRPSRGVSSTSEEEEALTEKFLKINCKYITDGKGVVSGVLLVTPNNIMFDPLRTDPLVLERGCEEYGIMCPLDEVQSAAVYREITDSKIRDSIPPTLGTAYLFRNFFLCLTLSLEGVNDGLLDSSQVGSLTHDCGVFKSLRNLLQVFRVNYLYFFVSGLMVSKEMQKSHKFLCLRVGKAMKKTFVSNASASMQQYAQRDRKHEYWFAVPQERSDHLYVFFIQWSPDVFGDGVGSISRDPGFIVVKKIEESEANEEQQTVDNSDKEWEVVSWTEYHRRIDALNSEDLRSLCKRLQITTKEDVNSKHGTSITASLEPETFKPNLNEPSDLLEAEQIEKLAKHLPPRTIGYHWNLAFSTSKHGMSIKTLYRAMQDQDSPMLLVIKDSDGQIFGALASEPFKVSEGFYGTGETFLFTFYPEFEAYKWTGDNLFFIKGDMDSLAFGGGSGEFGLWLDGDLYHGRSHSCKTFGNPMLSTKEDFFVQDIEIWSFE
uniref:Oxidation resistance protein 1 n=1 Tax=Cyprinus carpio TaxID=7962 RepID=A0A8C2GWT9_CYPCA